MGFAAIGAAMIGSSVYSADKARSNANKIADAQKLQAEQAAADAKKLAAQQQAQAEKARDDMIAAETRRRQEMAASEAETRRMQSDAAASALSDNTPNVQLGAGTAAGTTTTDARKRRADFRPEYASGITI